MNHIDRAYKNAKIVPINSASRIVLMSDCHRGYGGWADSFAVNQTTCFAALRHYERNGFSYIELGDGDELWENRRFSEISAVHSHVFWLLSQLYADGRLYMLYGNHDIDKHRKPRLMDTYCNTADSCTRPLFPGMPVYESLILRSTDGFGDIFLLHGHQADFLNDRLWRLARFFVRYFWRPLQIIGMKAPTNGVITTKRHLNAENLLNNWASRNRTLTVTGHTHRPMLPEPGASLYLNDGSCVHPRCITAIEISGGTVALVKWSHKTRSDGTLYVGRDLLSGPYRVADYYRESRINASNSPNTLTTTY